MHPPYVAAVLVLAALALVAAAAFRGWWRHEHSRPIGRVELAALAVAAVGSALAGLAVLFHIHIIAHPYPAVIGATTLVLSALVLSVRAR
ncbi:hypothetical protein U3A55_11615 [Salarchaeum sp. III]|uniref:hypothetical protein n=1 Tax=Salarchaeum sp. III TaxID=3107927 RepID=UPI002EDA0B48